MKKFPVFIFCIAGLIFHCQFLTAQSGAVSNPAPSFFRSIGVSSVFEIVDMPAVEYQKSFSGPGYVPINTVMYDERKSATVFSLTYELRKNFYHYRDRVSASASVPLEATINFYDTEGRIGSLVFPAFVDMNFGMHSTWNNIDRYGIHIGAGYQAIIGGILPTRSNHEDAAAWSQPVVRIGGKFPFRHRNCFLDAYYGFGSTKEYISGYNMNTQNYIQNKAQSKYYFKLAFGWLINYED